MVLQHSDTMSQRSGQQLAITIVPGSEAIARAMASICNDEQAACGVMSGHDWRALTLSGSDALRGIEGQFLLRIEQGRHHYLREKAGALSASARR